MVVDLYCAGYCVGVCVAKLLDLSIIEGRTIETRFPKTVVEFETAKTIENVESIIKSTLNSGEFLLKSWPISGSLLGPCFLAQS